MYSFLDIALILIMCAIVFRAWKRGFFASVMRIVSLIISAIASFLLYAPLAEYINNNFVLEPVVRSARNKISSLAVNGDIERLFAEMPDSFRSFLGALGFDPNVVYNDFASTDMSASSFADDLAQRIGGSVSHMISSAAALFILFVGCMIVLNIFARILSNLLRSSVLNFANKTLGLCIGVVSALIFGWVVSNGLILLTSGLRLFMPDAFSAEALENSFVIAFFARFKPF